MESHQQLRSYRHTTKYSAQRAMNAVAPRAMNATGGKKLRSNVKRQPWGLLSLALVRARCTESFALVSDTLTLVEE